MSQVITTIDLIRRAMQLINAIAAGEIPDDADLNDALLTLNEMIDSWNLQPLAAFGSPNESWVLTPGKGSYDWGLTAVPPDFTSDRPVRITNVTCTRAGIKTPVDLVSQEEYDQIAIPSLSQALIERVVYLNSYPLGRVTCYPVPSEAVTLNFTTDRLLVAPLTLQDTLAFPPGYLRALRYNLAVELWPEYTNTTTDIESIKKIARESFGKVKVANEEPQIATFDGVPGTGGCGGAAEGWRLG